MYQARGKFRELRQSVVQAQARIVGDQRGTHFLRADRRDIDLTPGAPVQFHVIAPWRDAKVYAKSVPGIHRGLSGQARPTPDARVEAIRAYDPAGGDALVRHRYRRAPQHAHAGSGRGFHHCGVQDGAAQTERMSIGEPRLEGDAAIDEAYALEGQTMLRAMRSVPLHA